jgi:hypothetical protein
VTLRKLACSELEDAGFNIGMEARPQVTAEALVKHDASSGASADGRAAEHVGWVVLVWPAEQRTAPSAPLSTDPGAGRATPDQPRPRRQPHDPSKRSALQSPLTRGLHPQFGPRRTVRQPWQHSPLTTRSRPQCLTSTGFVRLGDVLELIVADDSQPRCVGVAFLGLTGPLICILGGLVARSARLVTRSLGQCHRCYPAEPRIFDHVEPALNCASPRA